VRAVIIDDEPLARREMRRLLAEFPWLDIVGEAASAAEARTVIGQLSPQLIFLDVQMPGGSGFDLLETLEEVPRVIFTTAHDEHAVRAFEVNAFDYLLKPIDPRRLAAVLDRARQSLSAPLAAGQPVLEQLFVRDGARCWFVPIREVQLFTAEGNATRLWWGRERPLLSHTLAALERRLDAAQFFRANRRQVINLRFITGIEDGVNGALHVQLREGPEIEISRRQARLFRALTSL
jgi:two-component system LytT family response regulator